MFCFQCQEAAQSTGCVKIGTCGKNPEVSNLLDLLVYSAKGLALFTLHLRPYGKVSHATDKALLDALFTSVTNANFDAEVILSKIKTLLTLRNQYRKIAERENIEIENSAHDAALWSADTVDEFNQKSETIGVLATTNEDIRSLRELLVYGLKGVAAYADHALNLGEKLPDVYGFIEKALVSTLNDGLNTNQMIALVMECGENAVNTMANLDKANTTAFGHPEISKVNIGVKERPAILVSGHDLKDIEELLKQTEWSGVDVYTHSEMLPAHYYPKFKKYKHFVGNYGNAWWQQVRDFEKFNGPILFTSNCIVPPPKTATYVNRVFTTGSAGYPGFKHISDGIGTRPKDFSEIIEFARKCQSPTEIERGEIIGGFAHNQVLALADKVVEAVKSGSIRKFIVMAGCDGRSKARQYYTDFAESLPNDTVILTAGCAKYRYNKLQLGDIDGIPRVLDAGQCNDSYSLAVIALKLKEVFGLDNINDLPIVYNIAWYEQKAVTVLLALLYLGVKNIHLGPTLPAFLSPNVAKVLIEKFDIAGITNVDTDIVKMVS